MSASQTQRADAWVLAALVFGMLFGFMMGLAAMHQERNAARHTLVNIRNEAVKRGYMEVWDNDTQRVYRWKDKTP